MPKKSRCTLAIEAKIAQLKADLADVDMEIGEQRGLLTRLENQQGDLIARLVDLQTILRAADEPEDGEVAP